MLVLGQVFDAVSNPIIGRMSDALKSRFGRRKVRLTSSFILSLITPALRQPWLVVSAIPFGLSYFGLFVTWDSPYLYLTLSFLPTSLTHTCPQVVRKVLKWRITWSCCFCTTPWET